jgi:heat shock protein HslJ
MKQFMQRLIPGLLMLTLTACKTTTKQPSSALRNAGIPWNFKGAIIDGQYSKTLKNPERFTIEFRNNGIVVGHGIINDFFGQVKYKGEDGISFSTTFGQTMHKGSKVEMARDNYFMELLRSMDRFYIKKNHLYMRSEDGTIITIFTMPLKSS